MKVIFNRFIPFPGFIAITIWPFIFVRSDARSRYGETADRHEHIHGWQQVEFMVTVATVMLGIVGLGASWWLFLVVPFSFYLFYAAEYIVRLLIYRNTKEAYRNISFEQEAYLKEADHRYLSIRMPFAWIKYLSQKTYLRKIDQYRSQLNSDNF